jgi:BioD-like phosphotransacetylase family protein
MEVQFSPDVEKQLNDLAAQSGRGAKEVLLDALAGYLEEVKQTRQMLNSRYDDLKSGKVRAIPGDEVEAYFREKSAAARRAQQAGS